MAQPAPLKSLFLDAFVAHNVVVYKDNATMKAALEALTVDTLLVTDIAVADGKYTAKVAHSDNKFKGSDQSWTRANVNALSAKVSSDKKLASKDAVATQTVAGLYVYPDNDMNYLAYVYDSTATTAAQKVNLISALADLGYDFPSNVISIADNKVTIDDSYVMGEFIQAPTVIAAEVVEIPATDYGALTFPSNSNI